MTETEQGLQVGDVAPDFALPNQAGEIVRLSDLRGKRVVLFFYPKDDTPGCTAQACGFRDHHPEIVEQNAVVIGISPDSVTSHQKFKTKYNLPFVLLADEQHTVAAAYGVWQQKSMLGRKYFGIVRSHFVIDEEGRIVDARIKVSPSESIERALAVLSAQ